MRYLTKKRRCPKCNSRNIVKNSFNQSGRQLWKCNNCGYRSVYKIIDKCLLCDEPIYAKELCKKHYFQSYYRDAKAKKLQKKIDDYNNSITL